MTPRGVRKLETPEPFKVLVHPGHFDIIVEEARPGYVVMRRWVPRTNGANGAKGAWKRKAIGAMTLRDARGAILPAAVDAARHAASSWYLALTGEAPAAPVAEEAPRPLTVGQTYATITHARTGKYPHPSQFRTELKAALATAVTVWGEETAWPAIEVAQWTALIRYRVSELVARKKVGIRATEITVSRIMTAVIWLRKLKLIPANAAHIDPDWRDDLLKFWRGLTQSSKDPTPNRPRYTVEESRALINAAWDVDPRSGLLLALGAELRLGQVRRSERTDLNLSASDYGEFAVHGIGDKLGEVIELTRGQRAAVEQALHAETGYIRALEAAYQAKRIDNYFLFAGGKLFGRKGPKGGRPYVRGTDPDSRAPLSRSAISRRWALIEFLAGITHEDGRGAYGVRRGGVDNALDQNISEHGLKSFGGWSTPDMPRRVYADRANRAGRADASKARARFRGEAE
jgi:integrase